MSRFCPVSAAGTDGDCTVLPVVAGQSCGVVGVLVFAWAVAACQEGTAANPELGVVSTAVAVEASAPACPRDLPSECPSPEPSWSADVQAIVAGICGQCHADGGIEQSAFDFSTYQGVFMNRGSILDQLYACAMPPEDAGVAISLAEREAFLGWLVCNAPNN